MKYNLLKMTQLILSGMDGDEVNDIADTTESVQVVDIIETTYNDMRSIMDMPEHEDYFELTATSSATPTLMTVPSNVINFDWIQYDNSETGDTDRNWVPVYFMDERTFIDRMNTLDTADSNVFQYNYSVGTATIDIRGYNDLFPTYYTITGNDSLLFDNYKVAEESNLVSNKTQCFGKIFDSFTRSNTWTPDFSPQNFSMFFNECMSACSIYLRQVQNPKADQRARQGKIAGQTHKYAAPNTYDMHKYPNFGRRSRFGSPFTVKRNY